MLARPVVLALAVLLAGAPSLLAQTQPPAVQPPAVQPSETPAAPPPTAQLPATQPPAAPPAIQPPETPASPPPAADDGAPPPAEKADKGDPAKPISGETVTLAARPAIIHTGEANWDDAEKALSDAVNLLYATAARGKMEIAGPPMVEYLENTGDDLRFSAFLPLAAAPGARLPDGVTAGETPAGSATKYVFQGAYEDLEDLYSQIDDQLAASGKTMARVIEEYVSDPTNTEPDQMVTHIYVFTE
jgi:hypothetical protein